MNTPHTSRAQRVLGYVAVVGILPYLLLKLAWTAGVEIGVTEAGIMQPAQMRLANALTAGMDLVAVLVVLALTHSWGLRLPAWLVVFPAWVGTGLLAPIAVAFPAIGAQLATHGAANGLAPWVTPVVYTSFAWQGITLLGAFALYARARWPHAFSGRASGGIGAPGVTGAVLASVIGVVQLVQALDSGLPVGTRGITLVEGVLACCGVVGAVLLRTEGRVLRVPVVLLWTGSAALFAWGAWNGATSGLLGGSGPEATEWALLAARTVAGVLLAATLLRALRQRQSEPSGERFPRA